MFVLHLLLYELQLHKSEKNLLFPEVSAEGENNSNVSKITWRRQTGGISQLWINCSPTGCRRGQGGADMDSHQAATGPSSYRERSVTTVEQPQFIAPF